MRQLRREWSSDMDLALLLEASKEAALAAGNKILEIYGSGDFSIEAKTDNSPLTLADKAAHSAILSILDETELPILSEEGIDIPFETRSTWEYFWMVDPLDGTKEFIKKNGEFTVNIALIHRQKPVLGVVYAPVLDEMYWAIAGQGSFREVGDITEQISISANTITDQSLRVVASRSHMSEETQNYVDTLRNPQIVSKGSSLKFLLVASGQADVYPRFGPTMEWDTAAADIIVTEAGGKVLLEDQVTPLSYNKENLLNPHFLVLGTV